MRFILLAVVVLWTNRPLPQHKKIMKGGSLIVYTHPYQVTLKYNQPFRVVAFGDIHWGARDCAEERFEREVLERYNEDPLTYFLGMGDIVDAIVSSDQKRYRATVIKAGFASREDILDQSIEEFATLWEKYKIPKQRLIGFLSGNHHDAILKRHGTDLTERLAYRLKTKNLGYSAFVKLQTISGGSHKMPVVIFAHHGFGGSSRTDGGSVTKYVRHAFRYQGADIYLYGHDHQKYAKRIAVVKPDWLEGHATDTSFVVAATGSFKRTVSHDEIPSYSEVAGYNPAELGAISIEICPRQAKANGRTRMRLEVSASE